MLLRFRPTLLPIVALAACWVLSPAMAQPPSSIPRGKVNYLFSGQMPPGVVGAARLQGRGAVQNYYQPVRLSGPEGVQFSMAENGTFLPPSKGDLHCGLLIGAVYRFKITNIPNEPGAEIFPTIEVIDRTYPPPGQAHRFPVAVNLEDVDLTDALEGRMVTRVIYLEDPQTALPIAETPSTGRSFNVMTHQDALQVADQLGRPVAILRIGSMSPPTEPSLLPQFFFGGPPWLAFTPPRTEASVPEGQDVVTRSPHIPRDDVNLQPPVYPGSYPPGFGGPQIAHPYGYGNPMPGNPATQSPMMRR